jgi:hypothetical protein
VLIESTSLTLKDRSTAPADPNRRKVVFKSSTVGDPAANQVVVPGRGTGADPTPGGGTGGGAVFEVYNSNGSGEKVSVTLPASGWSALDDSQTPRGYKYKSAAPTDAVTRVLIRGNLLKVRGGRSQWAYTLNETSLGRVAVRLTMGSAFRWCADTPAKSSGSPPSTASNDRIDKFSGARNTPAPASCPPVP